VLRALHEHQVRAIVIGGWEAILHSAARITNDVGLVDARDPGNLKALSAGRHDACFLPCSCHITGSVQVHEMAWEDD
jgi:hypothetical protein